MLSNYLYRNNNNAVIFVGSPIQIFQQYLFFSGYLNNHHEIPSGTKNGKYFVDNMLITNDCSDLNFSDTFIVSSQVKCANISMLTRFIEIQNEKDAGVIFKIYNDRMCSSIKLDPW